MAAVYDDIALQFQKLNKLPYRLYGEAYTYLNLIGDVAGKSILDLACGEGFFTRLLKLNGAARLVGVDISSKMIELARLEEASDPKKIEYIIGDVTEVGSLGSFDLVLSSYLLNYASSKEQLLKMCQAIAIHLKPGGRFVGLNNNLELPREFYHKHEKYGISRKCAQSLKEGTPITLTLTILDDGESISISFDNYYLSKATYEWALMSAGFKEICWHQPTISPEGIQKFGFEFWQDYIDYPDMVGITCIK
ncbi:MULTISPECIES: class I SAM-dependent methyltransferase [Nostoc]|uniref:Class I SAM-dependent methyltransferase n=1 Tax=Nostoc paludosum FACHB-159 TaxID=2692908 RepID=A0ABR8KGZ4_9NOSO|nr:MULTISPECIES: class I SAM-dependent methyltransferase [Nostoc]MBD2682486.1 class I SAM-dependent methyltransferase [Nostoc sp. FACHB-857]MBD2738816.1 class I SAM-dependent methyltransferase [Nostoc paludosum FACHB-159]